MRKVILLFSLIFSLNVFAQTGVYVPELAHFDSTMLSLISKYKIPGGQLAITYQGRLVYSRGFGLADTSTNDLVQPYSIFRLASVSKSITSIAIMHLFEKGLLRLDDKVFGASGILNDTIYQNAIDSRVYNITIRQLLDHSSGFKFDFANEPLWKTYEIAKIIGISPPTYSFELVLNWTLKNKTLGYDPGTSVYYSNFGYTVLGLVIKKISGQRYEDFVRNTILLPLGISEFYAGKTLFENKYANEVTYYDYPGAPLSTSIFTGIPNSVPAQYGGYNWEIMTPCGGWVASAQDLCKLLTSVDGFSAKPDILLNATIDTMTLKSKNWTEYALGWFVNADAYWHTGGIQGTATVIQCNRKLQINYSILFNSVPEIYTQFYYDFITMVTDDFGKIAIWPSHDFFEINSAVNYDVIENNSSVMNLLSISPNPASDFIEINLNGVILSEAKNPSIFDILGIEQSTPSILRTATPQEGNLRIDVSSLSPGVYFVRAGNVVRKFVKM